MMQAKQLSSRMDAQRSLLLSLPDLRAKKFRRTSVRVLCISTIRSAAPDRSDTSTSRSRHSSSTVTLSLSR